MSQTLKATFWAIAIIGVAFSTAAGLIPEPAGQSLVIAMPALAAGALVSTGCKRTCTRRAA
jgi:hypothetical protein